MLELLPHVVAAFVRQTGQCVSVCVRFALRRSLALDKIEFGLTSGTKMWMSEDPCLDAGVNASKTAFDRASHLLPLIHGVCFTRFDLR